MGFIFHYTLPPFLLCSALNAVFVSHINKLRRHSVVTRQPDVLIFASMFDFYLLFSDVYGFYGNAPWICI